MDNIYCEEILDHYRCPRLRGCLSEANASFEDDNPLCGDRVRMEVRCDDGKLTDVRFSGQGCAISQATASMLCENAIGCPLAEVTRWDKQKVLELLGIHLTPIRLKCALLPLKVLQAAIWTHIEQS